MVATRYVNYPYILPIGTYNYPTYQDAISNANNGDMIEIYNETTDTSGNTYITNLISFVYQSNNPPLNTTNEALLDNDASIEFIVALLIANNNAVNQLINGKTISVVYNGIPFNLIIMKQGTIIQSNGISISLRNNIKLTESILFGISTDINNFGFYIKKIDISNFNTNDYFNSTTNTYNSISNNDNVFYDGSGNIILYDASGNELSLNSVSILPIDSNNKIYLNIIFPETSNVISASSLSDQFLQMGKVEYYYKPINYCITKSQKTKKKFIFELSTSGVFVLRDYRNPFEYAIDNNVYYDQTTIVQTNKRSSNVLYSGGMIPMKGLYNGWRFYQDSFSILNWNLYNNKKDKDISQESLQYFWIIVNRIDNNPLNLQPVTLELSSFAFTTNMYTPVIGNANAAFSGQQILWYSPTRVISPPNNTQFNLIPSTLTNNIRIMLSDSSYIVSSLTNVNIILDGNNYNLYIQSYGYSTYDGTVFNIALNQVKDPTIPELNQIYLNNSFGYNLLVNKFINNSYRDMSGNYINTNSAYPIDYTTGAFDNSGNLITNYEGWLFNSGTMMSLDLYNSTEDYNNFHTIFIEIIVNKNSNVNIGAFYRNTLNLLNSTNVSNPSGTYLIDASGNYQYNMYQEHQILYIGNDPFSIESTIASPGIFTVNLVNNNNTYYSGNYSYQITYVTINNGEIISLNSLVSVIVTNNNIAQLTLPLSTDNRVININIYRTKKGGVTLYLLATVANNSNNSIYNDIISDTYLQNIFYPVSNTYTDGYVQPYFYSLNNALKRVNLNNAFSGTKPLSGPLNSLLLTVGSNSDIEIVSYGYKIKGFAPVKYDTRWSSIYANPLVRNIYGYFTIQKSAQVQLNESIDIEDNTAFTVKAYGNFISGSYQKNLNNYTNNTFINNVNVTLNKKAVNSALYILDSINYNYYNINTDGLKYKTSAVACVDANGNVVYNNGLISGVLVNNKYIIGNYKAISINNGQVYTVNNLSPNTFITNYDGSITPTTSNTKIFSKNSGINAVMVQGMYAALFKTFNKSLSIINNNLVGFVSETYDSVPRPTPITATLTGILITNNNFVGINYSCYIVTFITAIGETDSSIQSNTVVQGSTKYQNKLIVPISDDSRVIGRNIYRSDNANMFYLVGTINNNINVQFYDSFLGTPVIAPDMLALESASTDGKTARLLLYPDPANPLPISGLTPFYVYYYSFTYYNVTTGMETPPSLESEITVPPTTCLAIINIPIPTLDIQNTYTLSGVRIYRRYLRGGNPQLLTAIPNFTTFIYIDGATDASIISSPYIGSFGLITNNNIISLQYVNSTDFVLPLINNYSLNLTQGQYVGTTLVYSQYLYKVTYVTFNGETESGDFYTIINQNTTAAKILLTVPISNNSKVIGRNIYRTISNGSIFYLINRISDNITTIFIDDIADSSIDTSFILSNINTTLISAPVINTSASTQGNEDALPILLASAINETNLDASYSPFFNLYQASGRLANDYSEYTVNKRNNQLELATVQMNLENIQIVFKCKLRGSIYDISSNSKLTYFNRTMITKKMAEIIFGSFSCFNVSGQPQTLIREVIRDKNNIFGFDELGHQMLMIDNAKNMFGNYLVNKEIQYEIIIKVVLVQKN